MRKEETPITLANGGMHNQKAYVKMKAMLNNCNYINPRLYHLVLMGSEKVDEYQSALKALCFELRRKKMFCDWKSCIERDDDKRLHKHVFLLVESHYCNPDNIINHKKQGWLNVMLKWKDLNFHIAPPIDPMHRTKDGKTPNYATLAGEKLADCLIWISYLVKRRSKDDNMKHIYFGSRNNSRSKFVMA